MKPLNLDNSPCSPTSSNCIIWQGPDLGCIKLCKGDTISDVVAALATELCTVMDQLNVSNYDLSCFNLTACPPADFQALIQFLINHICALEGITPTTNTQGTATCPDCVVTVASCFIQGNNTTMQLVDYVTAIAERVCGLITSISDLQNQINQLDVRVSVLENTAAPTFTLPTISVDCTLQDSPYIGFGGSATAINTVLAALINDDTYGYCALRTATGLPAELQDAIASQCITSATTSLVYGTPMGTAYSGTWVGTPTTVADSLTDLWIALCDIYNYVSTQTFEVKDTNTIDLTYGSDDILTASIQDTGWVNLEGFTYMSANSSRPQCRRIGNVIHFKGIIQIPMGNSGEGASGTALTASSPDAYAANAYGKTLNAALTGDTNACYINGSNPTSTIPSGSTNVNEGVTLYFNRAQRVIPASVIPSTVNLDATTTLGNRSFVFRGINISGSDTAILSSIVGVFIDNNGRLAISAPNAVENYNGTGIYYSSMQRNVVSNPIVGSYIPLFDNTSPSANNGPSASTTYNADLKTLTSTYVWPFSQNCMSAFQLGGFSVRLDGLSAFISPCEVAIPTPVPCS